MEFEAAHGTVFAVPWETNRHLKHAVPHRPADIGRRISVTVRAFACISYRLVRLHAPPAYLH